MEGIQGIPCSRYEGGENDPRVNMVFGYTLGLLGGRDRFSEAVGKIARLYDYKGELYIATREELSPFWQGAFRQAWSDVGNEPSQHVQFTDINSDDWEMVWGSRRYDSEWVS